MGKSKVNKRGGDLIKKGKIMARHILVDKLSDAQAIHQQLQSGGNFQALARKHSTCTSRNKGGNIGTFSKSEVVKEFWDGAYALKKGEISKPIKSKFGYHIIKRMQ